LLDILLEARASGTVATDAEVKDQLLTFIIAGHDTTAHTLSLLLWEVARQPVLQEALAAEARDALPARGDFPSRATVGGGPTSTKLPLLERTWLEALREHPAAATGTLRRLGTGEGVAVGERRAWLPAG